MAAWVLGCLNCKKEFVHKAIDDYTLQNFLDPQKPQMPAERAEAICPHCGHIASYKRNHLMYRH
jgi:DNA-directed RNA polymerase subunit RPC12/RpoP